MESWWACCCGMCADNDEVDGLMAGLLTAGAVPVGATKLGSWLVDKKGVPGQRYASVLRRNYWRRRKLGDGPAGGA